MMLIWKWVCRFCPQVTTSTYNSSRALESHHLGVVQQEKGCEGDPGAGVELWFHLLFVEGGILSGQINMFHFLEVILAMVFRLGFRGRLERMLVHVNHD